MNFISNYFEFDKRGITLKTEVLGGATTFLTMAYVLFVIPGVLA